MQMFSYASRQKIVVRCSGLATYRVPYVYSNNYVTAVVGCVCIPCETTTHALFSKTIFQEKNSVTNLVPYPCFQIHMGR